MKTTLSLLLFLSCAFTTYSQNCKVQFKEYALYANHINAYFQPGGNKFSHTGKIDAGFYVPYFNNESPSTIFSSVPWAGGYDDEGQLRIAAENFPGSKNDFYPGPLSESGWPFDIPCEQFNQAWSVYSEEIAQHIQDAQDGMIDDTIASVFGWPAYGNIHFEQYNGFPLPGNKEWADFKDINENGTYEPELGEYPHVYFQDAYYIPDQILWMVFHDADTHSVSGGEPLHFEFQLTAFSFYCLEKSWLHNAIFNSYKIINRASSAMDSVFFGMWTDFDIGCSSDDFNGSDSLRHSEFAYNEDTTDGDVGFSCANGALTYEAHPPVQSRTYLSHPMHSLVIDRRVEFDQPPFEYTPEGRYNVLNGIWPDGTPMVADSTAYIPGSTLPPTKFMYHGDPRDPASWSENNFVHGEADRLPVSSVYIGRLEPGDWDVVEMAYMFHLDTTLDHLSQFTVMYNNLDSLFASSNNINDRCTPFLVCVGKDCVWPGDFNHNGIADHEDILTWGLMKDKEGPSRDRLINWKGHGADVWAFSTLEDVNFKHGDGDGNGMTNDDDLHPLHINYKLTNPYYEPKALYPEGPEVVISSGNFFSNGTFRGLKVSAGLDLQNVFGLSFEVEFDTTLYMLSTVEFFECPEESNMECFFDSPKQKISNRSDNPRYAIVKTDHRSFDIDKGFEFYYCPLGLRLKEGVTYEDLPDTIRIRIKNLLAIDSVGNDLHIGANELVHVKHEVTAITEVSPASFSVFPNPATDELFFDVEKEMDIQVFTSQGHLVDRLTVGSHKPVNISGYIPGVYFLKAVDTGHVVRLVIF